MLVFLFIYVLMLAGILRPMSDVTVITRLEPIMFLVIGYFLARLPAAHSEQTIREEIKRQSIRAERAEQAKQESETEMRTLEEKMRNARIALDSSLAELRAPGNKLSTRSGLVTPTQHYFPAHDVETAVRILSSSARPETVN